MNDPQLTHEERARYERHLIVDEFSEEQQQKLKAARVLVIGAGGLGSAVLPYLAAAGVGALGLVEFDSVSSSNLQRQVLYTTNDLGAPKAELAAERLISINPGCEITTFALRLDEDNAEELFEGYDWVVDCSDNYATRYLIDHCSRKLGLPMIYGTAQESEGQVSVFNTPGAGSYADLYPETEQGSDDLPVGVISPMPGIIGCIQAMEVIKLITGYGKPLIGRLLTVDAKTMTFKVFDL